MYPVEYEAASRLRTNLHRAHNVQNLFKSEFIVSLRFFSKWEKKKPRRLNKHYKISM